MDRVGPRGGVDSKQSLEMLVTEVASRIMGVNSADMVTTTEGVLEDLLRYFDVDHCCLRYNDHSIRASTLVAEYPVRGVVPDPDPLGTIYFADADDVFAALEVATTPFTGRPGSKFPEYQRRVREGAGWPEVSFAAAPLVPRDIPTGFLSLTKKGDRVWEPDEVNALQAIAALFAQLQGRIAAEERLLYLATHDDLTGLSNRRALLEYMGNRLAAGEVGPVGAIFIDVDRLKALNDFLGHSAGDEFIHAVARRLRDQTDPRDMIARLGGDEFVIIPALPMAASDVESEAERLRALVGERVILGGVQVSRSVSIGVAVGQPGQSTVSDVLRQADQALLVAKSSGGNRTALFTSEMRSEFDLRDEIELHLRHAVENDSLVLHYQPEVSLLDGEILGVEALVRWNHPTRGMLQPSAFIEIAEATNLAGELGRWVLRTACGQLADWRKRGIARHLIIRVNVSPVQLVSLDFVESIADLLSEFSLDGQSLCLEITEHVVVQDLDRTRITLKGLDALGVRVAIDDFGTGYSSLSHLKALNVHALKIDRGFVRGLGQNDGDRAIVKSIVGLAESFGLDIVAEGVETEVAVRTLLELGCERAQGFLLSKPLVAQHAESLLIRGRLGLNFSGYVA